MRAGVDLDQHLRTTADREWIRLRQQFDSLAMFENLRRDIDFLAGRIDEADIVRRREMRLERIHRADGPRMALVDSDKGRRDAINGRNAIIFTPADVLIVEDSAHLAAGGDAIDLRELLRRLPIQHSFDNLSAYRIRKDLRADVLAGDSSVTKFLLADNERVWAYCEAGGRIEESLFTEETLLLDGALARKTADRLLFAEAERIMELEGWGGASISGEDDDYPNIEPDYAEAEEQRLDDIADMRKLIDIDADRRAAIEAEGSEIENRAILRAVSRDERAALGVRAELLPNGSIDSIRGVSLASPTQKEPRQDEEDDDLDEASPRAAPSGERKERKPAEPPAPEPAKVGKQVKVVLDEAVNEALRNATARNLNLSLVYCVAVLGCSYGRAGIGLSDPSGYWRNDPKSELLESIRHERFEKALLKCIAAPLNDLTTAFSELVARSIDVSKAEQDTALILLAAASRLCEIRKSLASAFDYQTYFEASPRDVAIAAIRALDGDALANDSGKLKKPELVLRAAALASDKHWLPVDFDAAIGASSEPKVKDRRSTAQAMRDAIVQDEAKQSKASAQETEPKTNREKVAAFLKSEEETGRLVKGGSDIRIKASTLCAAFNDWVAQHGWPAIAPFHLSKALGANGVEKTRLNNGVHYLGLALKEAGDEQQAAE
jgi:ParB family chromosome partitioning protein